MDTKISLIIPAYNIQDYIVACLDSVVRQTHKNLEIIVIDDGSVDNTPAILDEYAQKDNRIRIIHKANGGVTSARLLGVAEASGDYIGFVDGDDCVEPAMFQRLLENAEKYDADISHCGYQMVFPSHTDLYYGTGCLIQQDKQTGLKDLLTGDFIEPGLWNKLFRKTLFQNLLCNTLMDTSIRINEDLLMNFYLFRESRQSVFEDICSYHYVVRKGSAATSKINVNKLLDPIKVTRILLQETKDNQELNNICRARLIYKLINLATMQLDGNKDLIQQYSKAAQNELRGMLPAILQESYCNKKLKLLAVWAAICPLSYKLVHFFYSKITGLDKKYEVA